MVGRFLSRFFGCLAVGAGSDDKPVTSIRGHKGNKKDHYHWEKKLAHHLYGQYSMALAQANIKNEDRCQLVSGPLSNVANGPTGVFVGVYDGHGGYVCSQFVLDNLFRDLKTAITNQPGHVVNPVVIQAAYQSTEERFVEHVRRNWRRKPALASMGSCCLSGVVHGNMLYVANAGDSRAVLAKWPDRDGPVEVHQLSIDYNANDRERRDEVRAEHPDDPDLFKVANGSYRVRGNIQVTRAIGDVYLKFNEFNRAPLEERFRQQQPIDRPILKAEPTVQTYQLGHDDRFVIFGSDGLWGDVTNAEAVAIVKASPRSGAARALLKKALEKTGRRNNLRYEDCIKLPLDQKRYHHDDISIVVLFFDNLPSPVTHQALSVEL